MNLEEYNRKRDFTTTSEPEGKQQAENSKKLKFVVQRHSATRLHYDFRLEMDGVLKSWAVPKGPSLNPTDKRLAMQVEDHPLSYRTFEGSIPEGSYGGGEVEIWDEGWYEPLDKSTREPDDTVMQKELHKESLKFVLHGEKLQGEFALVKIKSAQDGKSWLLIKHNDGFSTKEAYNAEEFTEVTSKVTKRENNRNSGKKSISEATAKAFKNYAPALSGEKKLAAFIHPMMAQTAAEPFNSKEWIFEIKWDGYRAIADLRSQPMLYSRNGLDFSQKFKNIYNALKIQTYPMVLDGEIVAYDETGKPNFQWLQQIGEKKNPALVFQVFDLLWLNGHSTENLTLIQRKELLRDALQENEVIKYCDHIYDKGEEFFKLAENMGLEGIMAKKSDSKYAENSRSSDWLKIKTHQTEEVLICGFTAPKGSRKKFGSLILGKYNENNELIFAGHTGTGFSDQLIKEISLKMENLIVQKSPFGTIPKTNAEATWIRPELIAEIKFTEVTKDGQYRHPVFLRLREDKAVKDMKVANTAENNYGTQDKKQQKETITSENNQKTVIGTKEVKLTNQNKVYFPKDNVTKGDVVAYYQSVAEYILPYLKDRPQSLNRFPNGIEGMSFYQKDASEDTPPWVHTKKIFSESNDKIINYIICNDTATLAYLNNLGCIELNVWTARYQNPENPDYLVLDLDPSENNTFEDVIETANVVKALLDKANIQGYPKTSGSTGIHIYIPMQSLYSYEQVKDFGHILMQFVQKELPELTTLERALQKRDKNKIYLDYLQNRRGQTLASIYSLRPKSGAPVSMALEWSEVKAGLKPTDWNIENALQRLKNKGDLFKPVLGEGIDMLRAVGNLHK